MTEPLPEAGWSREIVTLKNARVFPPLTEGLRPVCGVLSDQGDCLHASTWRGGLRLTQAPEGQPRPTARLAGRHIWGGLFYGHFGHFLTETMSRCWAFDDDSAASVLFVPKHDKLTVFGTYRAEYWSLLGITAPPQILTAPVEVEELVVPGQGFGLGRIARGTPEYRARMRRLAATLPSDAPRRIYISRTRFQGRGGILAEASVEANMIRHGYTVIHPERLSLTDQLRHYKSATHIVGVDSSAFHVAAMVAGPDTQVAFILRREDNAYDSIAAQIEGMTGRPPHIIRTLVANWADRSLPKSNHLSWGELDHARLAAELAARGFIASAADWAQPSTAQIDASLTWAASRAGGQNLVRLPSLPAEAAS